MVRIIFLLFILFSSSVSAINLQGYRFTDSYRYSVLDDSFLEKFSGKYVFTLSGAYIRSPFYVTDNDVTRKDQDIISYDKVLTAGASYYFSKYFSLGLNLNYINNKVFDKKYSKLADSYIKARWNIYNKNNLSFSVNPQLAIPTGAKNNFSTIDSIGTGVSAVGEHHNSKWHYLLSVGYMYAEKNKYLIVDYRSMILGQLGISYDVNSKLNVNAEAIRDFTYHTDEKQDDGDYYLTAKHKCGKYYSAYAGAGLAGLGKIDRNNYTAFLGFKIHEKENSEPIVPVVVEAPAKEIIEQREDEKKLGVLLKAENIYFENGRHTIGSKELEKLKQFVVLHSTDMNRIKHVVIEGYASKRGNHDRNFELSQKRANAIRNYLIDSGISEEKLSIVAYGDDKIQEVEEWQNRKVQFRIYE